MRQWLENWKVAAPILDADRVARLRQLDEAAAARVAVDLWSMARVGTGDSGEGLKPMKDALRWLTRRR